MSNKSNRNGTLTVRSNIVTKSTTPVKLQKKVGFQSKKLDCSLSTPKTATSRNLPSEPLRLAIKLEDIVKISKKSGISNLKTELIEPEVEAFIPSIKYVSKEIHPAFTNLSLNSPMDSTINDPNKTNDINNFSFDSMNENCKKIEESIVLEKHKQALEEIEKAIGEKFNCSVQLVPDSDPKFLPMSVIVKSGENIKLFSVSRL
jgi:hypothetical protein